MGAEAVIRKLTETTFLKDESGRITGKIETVTDVEVAARDAIAPSADQAAEKSAMQAVLGVQDQVIEQISGALQEQHGFDPLRAASLAAETFVQSMAPEIYRKVYEHVFADVMKVSLPAVCDAVVEAHRLIRESQPAASTTS